MLKIEVFNAGFSSVLVGIIPYTKIVTEFSIDQFGMALVGIGF